MSGITHVGPAIACFRHFRITLRGVGMAAAAAGFTACAQQAATLFGLMNDSDPRPQPPEKPLPGDCCDGGCDPCVYDVYADELAAYEKALAAWRARHPQA